MFLEGKRALVTGSTSGIGLAIARSLHAEGAEIVLNGFKDDEDKVAELQEELGGAKYKEVDLGSAEGVEELVDFCGPADIVVGNAGMQHVAKVEEFPPAKWDQIIALNLSANFHLARLTVPHMKEKGWGRVLYTASAHSLVASPNKTAYVAAKHGIAGMVKVLALELAQCGVTANCISPGYVWTPLVENQIPDTMESRGLSRDEVINDVLLSAQPTKEFVQPEEIGAMACFLCRDEAHNITGSNWVVDGGWTAQ